MIDGAIVEADENYLRESILDSTAGWSRAMPDYAQLSRADQRGAADGILAYIKASATRASLKKTD